jgi:hypothetical protein
LVHAQAYSAVVVIQYEPATIQLANTAIDMALPITAQTPLGSGDRVQTAERGRVWVRWAGLGELLLLSNSTFTLDAYERDGRNWRIQGTLQGVGVFRWSDPAVLTDFVLRTEQWTITQPAAQFAVWAQSSEPHSILVAEGTALIQNVDEAITVKAGEGWRSDSAGALSVPSPLNAAQLHAQMVNCTAIVQTNRGQGLLVRQGPNESYNALDLLPDQTVVSLVGRIPSVGLSRIQYRSFYGWVVTLGLQTTCARIPTLDADLPPETWVRVWNSTPLEQTWLAPYFGTLSADPWFYRFTTR